MKDNQIIQSILIEKHEMDLENLGEEYSQFIVDRVIKGEKLSIDNRKVEHAFRMDVIEVAKLVFEIASFIKSVIDIIDYFKKKSGKEKVSKEEIVEEINTRKISIPSIDYSYEEIVSKVIRRKEIE